jgi:hypothetical protein
MLDYSFRSNKTHPTHCAPSFRSKTTRAVERSLSEYPSQFQTIQDKDSSVLWPNLASYFCSVLHGRIWRMIDRHVVDLTMEGVMDRWENTSVTGSAVFIGAWGGSHARSRCKGAGCGRCSRKKVCRRQLLSSETSRDTGEQPAGIIGPERGGETDFSGQCNQDPLGKDQLMTGDGKR